jgi:radical SAM superfamily enzyme YgiQ (UPF0313 family)
MALAILAALTPRDIDLRVTDELVDDIDYAWPADAVALSVNTTSSPRSYAVARHFRELGAKVIMGGIHPSVMPDEAQAHADAVVIGEAEAVWPQVLDDLRASRLRERYEATHPDPADIPAPRWDMVHGKRYFTRRTFQVSRGCPYGCEFCSSTRFFGTKYRFRPIERVVEEVKSYPKRFMVFVDDNIVGRADYSRELFKALKPLKKRWVAQASIDIARKDDLLRLAKESGCAGVLIGLESVRPENRESIKKMRSIEEYEAAIAELRRAGIGVHGSFVFGFDGDTADVVDATVDFVLRNKLEVANYCKLTPYPGTKLYERFNAEGRITESDFSRFDRYNLVFEPQGMGRDELYRKADEAYARTYSLPSILRRIPMKIQNIPYYFAINLSYRMGARKRRK